MAGAAYMSNLLLSVSFSLWHMKQEIGFAVSA
jgi:hypothetical protein